jgi:phosphatidylinositol 4-kinase
VPEVYRTDRAGSDHGLEPGVAGLIDSVRAEAGRRRDIGAGAASAAGASGAPRGLGRAPSALEVEEAAVDAELAEGLRAFEDEPSMTDLEDARASSRAEVSPASASASASASGSGRGAPAAKAPAGAASEAADVKGAGVLEGKAVGAAAAGAAAAGDGEDDAAASDKAISVAFRQPWREVTAEVRAASPFGRMPGWRLVPMIVKSNDDLRQEQFVASLLRQFALIWKEAGVPVWVRPYDILATQSGGGVIEAIADTISVDSLKRGLGDDYASLGDFYVRHWGRGKKDSVNYKAARKAFVSSMAGYAIICYLLNIKDRHNGNILIDRMGHMIHIDFGFLLSNSPGGNMNFEAAPFKLTKDFVGVMGGARSRQFAAFRNLCTKAFLEVRKRKEKIILLVEMMMDGNGDLACFRAGKKAIISQLRARFNPTASSRQCVAHVNALIDQSMDNWRTRWYDSYQKWSVGIH